MRSRLTVVRISPEWHYILAFFFSAKGMKVGRGREGLSTIIEPALAQYEPLLEFIKEQNLKLPKCEEK